MYIVLAPADRSRVEAPDAWEALTVTDDGAGARRAIGRAHLPALVQDVEAKHKNIRWVYADYHRCMPLLLEQGVTISRAHDLRLAQRILATAASRVQNNIAYEPAVDLASEPDRPLGRMPLAPQIPGQDALFADLESAPSSRTEPTVDVLAQELEAQLQAIKTAPHPDRLRLLLAAESQGGIIAAEMKHTGMPWNRAVHEALLAEALGARPPLGQRPPKMEELAIYIRQLLHAPQLNPDSPQELLKALNRAGVAVDSTNKWELRSWANEHPAQKSQREQIVEPILAYKKMYRLYTANGWNWLDEWVHNDRFYPSYEVGGVVTGRWGASGGGAMQIPSDVRSAVRAEEGKVLIVSDASQVEPRILAALAADSKLAIAGSGKDLYMGIAELGARTGSALTERKHAKIALLGAMYGATTGESGRLMPHLKKMFPQAIEFTEHAARIGERGGQVTTFLGRTSPAPSAEWFRRQRHQESAADEQRARRDARSWGRFTRNFVVQGTAAEWAICWMGNIRSRLRSERLFGRPLQSQLVYFLHDEIMIYGPEREAKLCEKIIRESARDAATMIFGQIPVDFPVTVTVTDDYSKAK